MARIQSISRFTLFAAILACTGGILLWLTLTEAGNSDLSIETPSRLSLAGSEEPVNPQIISLIPGPEMGSFLLDSQILFPRLFYAFGQFVDVTVSGIPTGTLDSATGEVNIGSDFEPMLHQDACECGEEQP